MILFLYRAEAMFPFRFGQGAGVCAHVHVCNGVLLCLC